ncbi:hypothetical protein USDA257_c11810 [Sinorhizobium fredii USDA 257]|uniref:Uncharacterized protein n=1 Tax=Sinorhizobium fredii (strain USDA 257) TaxID=1185652 RepID=I3X1L6_SINF2|nr:hypothetical protein USDA257_c11810 [Sinorhizobium fredii USDA 257]
MPRPTCCHLSARKQRDDHDRGDHGKRSDERDQFDHHVTLHVATHATSSTSL